MIDQELATQKTVASIRAMRQLSRMRTYRLIGTLTLFGVVTIALCGCSLPAPYQTYSPGGAPVMAPPPVPLVVYGATTTTPDMVPDSGEPEPTPAPAIAPSSSASGAGRVAICYNRLWNKPDAIRSAAMRACGTNNAPRITDQNLDIDACPLLTPTKAVFACSVSSSR